MEDAHPIFSRPCRCAAERSRSQTEFLQSITSDNRRLQRHCEVRHAQTSSSIVLTTPMAHLNGILAGLANLRNRDAVLSSQEQ